MFRYEFWLSLFLIAAAGGLFFYCRHKIYYHFKVVVPGQLYRSGTLGTVGLYMVGRQFKIKTIINLRTEKEYQRGSWYEKESRFCKQNSIVLVDIPMKFDTPPDTNQIRRFLDVVMGPARQPVLVHCEAGIIRTGMMVAVFLKHRFGTPNAEIVRQLPLFGHSLETEKRKNRKIKEFILNYQPVDPVPRDDV